MAHLSDERLSKNAGNNVRSDRTNADADRTNKDGTALSAEERRRMLRDDWVQEILPTPPKIPGYHTCWLSTSNSMDPIYKRIQRGYIPVLAKDVAGFSGNSNTVKEGEFSGCVACNEMLLFKIDDQTYQDIMTIFHYDMPLEAERGIYEKASVGTGTVDSNGKPLDFVEGDFNNLGRKNTQAPTFN